MKHSCGSTVAFNTTLKRSKLFDEKTFYNAFLNDLKACREEIIIESPYITSKRMRIFYSLFQTLLKQGVKIYIITRDPKEHEKEMMEQATYTVQWCERVGIQVLLCAGNDHRKLAILDRKVLWEGSLNILSQTHSREIMRRIEDKQSALEMFSFLKLSHVL